MIFQVGDVLRKWRGKKPTIEELAEKTGLDKNTISRAERNQTTRTDTLEQIVTALGHTMSELHEALGHIDPADAAWLTLWKGLSEESRDAIGPVIRRARSVDDQLADAAAVRGAGGGGRGPAPQADSASKARSTRRGTASPRKRSRKRDGADHV